MQGAFTVVSVALSLLVWCTPSCSQRSSSHEVVRVGAISLSERSIDYRERLDSCYSGTLTSNTDAAVELISDGLEADVLRSAFGLTPPLKALLEKSAWIDSNTKAPEKLGLVKKLFGKDTTSYLELFVAPTLVNEHLHRSFIMDTEIQRTAKDSIESIWAALQNDPNAILRYHYDTIVTPKHPSRNSALGSPAAEIAVDPLIDRVLKNLTVNKIWPKIIEDDRSFKIVALIANTDSEYRSIAIIVKKKDFDDWYRTYVHEHVPIRFTDRTLEADIRKSYPYLWWLSQD